MSTRTSKQKTRDVVGGAGEGDSMPVYERTNYGNSISSVDRPIESPVAAFSSDADYHSDFGCISKTMLNKFFDSPVEYYLTYVTRELEPWAGSKFTEEGHVVHTVLLENQRFEDVVQVYPDSCLNKNGDLIGANTKKIRQDNPGVLYFKHDRVERLKAMVASLMDSELMEAIDQSANMEKRHDAILYGLPSRCKPDIVCPLDEYVPMWDLKFTARIAHSAFNRVAKSFRYWLQDVHYSAIAEAVYGKPGIVKFFRIEAQFPFRVFPCWYPERAREVAKQSHANKMWELAECMKTNVWKDRWPNELTLEPWDVDEQDQMVEFGEDVEVAS